MTTQRKLARGFFILLLVSGIFLVLIWGLLFNVWLDVGLYSVAVMLIGFGLIGTLLYGMPESEGETGPK